ncbi:flavin reductase family protein (plasmid) [Streptomyces microflavus]|uniref:Flavin reductase family protein n=1 Tax=Streptomyces microflavus TaxID=1919 RepID=A0A7H8N0S0_STRMI|nr:flavin reductase family protein [Streptomyces microflavus]
MIVSSPEFRPRRWAGRSAAYPGRLAGRLWAGATSSSVGGFTCQSFTALSLDPPGVALALGKSSTSWPCIREAGSSPRLACGLRTWISMASSRSSTPSDLA